MMHGIWELSPKFSDNTKYDKNSEAGAHHFWGTSWGISSGQINSRDRFTIFLRRCWSSGSHVSLFLCFCCTPKKTYPLVNEYITMERSTMLILYIPTLSGVVLFMGKFTKFQWWIVPVRYPFTRPGTSSPQPPGNRSERYPATDMAVPWARPKSGGWPSESSEPGQLPGQLPGWSRLDEIPHCFAAWIAMVGRNSYSFCWKKLQQWTSSCWWNPCFSPTFAPEYPEFPMQNLFEFPLLSCENPGCIPMFSPENFAKASPPNRSKTCSPRNLEVWRRTQQHSRRRGWWSFSLANLFLIVW